MLPSKPIVWLGSRRLTPSIPEPGGGYQSIPVSCTSSTEGSPSAGSSSRSSSGLLESQSSEPTRR